MTQSWRIMELLQADDILLYWYCRCLASKLNPSTWVEGLHLEIMVEDGWVVATEDLEMLGDTDLATTLPEGMYCIMP